MGPRLVHYIRVAPFAGAVYLSVDRVTLARFLVLMAGLLLFAVPIRCPRCGKRVDYNPAKALKGAWAYTICVPKKCSRCRYPLTRPLGKPPV